MTETNAPKIGADRDLPASKATVRIHHEGAPGGRLPTFAVNWFIFAPWAHPVWSEYYVSLAVLETRFKSEDPVLLKEGVTHELVIFAINPDTPYGGEEELKAGNRPQLLMPANHGYQFTAESNQAALDRVQSLVTLIEQKKLSPDTDYRFAWDHVFADGASLRDHGNVASDPEPKA